MAEKKLLTSGLPPGVKSGRLLYSPEGQNSRLGQMLGAMNNMQAPVENTMYGLDPSIIANLAGQARSDDQMIINALSGIENRAMDDRNFGFKKDAEMYGRGQDELAQRWRQQQEMQRRLEADRSYKNIALPTTEAQLAATADANRERDLAARLFNQAIGHTGTQTPEQAERMPWYFDHIAKVPMMKSSGETGVSITNNGVAQKHPEEKSIAEAYAIVLDTEVPNTERLAATRYYNSRVKDAENEMLYYDYKPGRVVNWGFDKAPEVTFNRVKLGSYQSGRITPSMVRKRAEAKFNGDINATLKDLLDNKMITIIQEDI